MRLLASAVLVVVSGCTLRVDGNALTERDAAASPPTDATSDADPRSTLMDGLVGHWQMDEGAGTAVLDSVGNNDGTLIGAPIWGEGHTGGGLTFDGLVDGVGLGSIELANRSFTFAAWIRPIDGGQVHHNFIGVETFADPQPDNESLHLRVYPTGQFRFGYFADDLDSAEGVVPFDAWTHVVATYDQASDQSIVYLNGVVAASGPQGPFTGVAPTFKFAQWRTRFFGGTLDDIRQYDRALSAAEAAALSTLSTP